MLIVQLKKSCRTLHTVQSHFKNSNGNKTCTCKIYVYLEKPGKKSEQAVTLCSELVERREESRPFLLTTNNCFQFKTPIKTESRLRDLFYMAPEDNIMTNRWQDLSFYKEKKNTSKVFLQRIELSLNQDYQKCIPIYGFGIYNLILDEQDI